jgi:phage shock protein C
MTTTKTRTQSREQDSAYLRDDEHLDLELLTDEELDTLLFDEEQEKPKGALNLPTLAGLSLILVGIAYVFQQLGLWGAGIDLTFLASLLPWVAGLFIILLGFGVLSWRPNRANKKKLKVEKKLAKQRSKQTRSTTTSSPYSSEKRRLFKSANKKAAGVCSGIAEYFSIDPTIVRIGFAVGTLATGPAFILAYVLLAFIMPSPEKRTLEERITIIRDS